QSLHHEFLSYLNYMSPTETEAAVRTQEIATISNAIKSKYPDATAHPFGSFGTNLYLPCGDLDLVIISPTLDALDQDLMLRDVASCLVRSGVTTDDKIQIISKALVPILKFTTSLSNISVDICFNMQNGLHAVKFVNTYKNGLSASGKLALRGLVYLLKAFFTHHHLNEVRTGGLSSYAIVLLVIRFLQHLPRCRKVLQDQIFAHFGTLVFDLFEFYATVLNWDIAGMTVVDEGRFFVKLNYPNAKRTRLYIEDPINRGE
ncbi:hypothetical protein GYMLUDRAFT_163199, partial [Collybiopsis luxurians FD-317 M1]